ncbi:MAG: T9SS type A sorting domain-containing protein, partial [Bacteroidota bacterium]
SWTEAGEVVMDGDAPAGEEYTFTATEDRDLVANFALATYMVTFDVINEYDEPITDAVITMGNIENDAGDYVFEDIEPGEYPYTATAEGYKEVTDTIEVIDSDLSVEVTMETDDTGFTFADLSNVTIYPNPADDRLFIELDNEGDHSVTISLINIHGQVVRSQHVSDPGVTRVRLTIDDLLPGMYMLRITVGDRYLIERVILR